MEHIVTRESLTTMLSSPNIDFRDAVIGRACGVLLRYQTADEKTDKVTKHNNGVGFSSADSFRGQVIAEFWARRGWIKEWMVEWATQENRNGVMRLAKYWRQLDNEAQQRAN